MSRRAKRHEPSPGLIAFQLELSSFAFLCRETASSYDADVSTVDDESERKEQEDRLVRLVCPIKKKFLLKTTMF
jgi:hypothetical protein